MKEFTITKEFDSLPPSLWQAYGRRKTGGLYLKPEAKTFKEMIGWSFKECKVSKQDFGVEIFFEIKGKQKHDLDNYIKIVLDSLTRIVYEDDQQVIELHLFKQQAKKDKTIISIWEI